MTSEADALWRAVAGLCPPGPPPCADIARRTGLADATVSDWFRKKYVPTWPRFQRFLAYFPATEHRRLEAAWRAAWGTERSRRRAPAAPPVADDSVPAPTVAQLPYDIADFTGRHREVEQLEQLLARDPGTGLTIVVVAGMAGAGKTRLAVHVLRRAGARLGDVQLYVDLGGFSHGREPAAPADVLAALLRHLGVPDARVPDDLDGRAALYRDRLDGRHAVVLLDNADSTEQVRPLLPGSPSCRVLITSRRALDGLDGAVPLTLGTFDEADALALLSRIAGAERTAAEPAAARRIVESTGRLPLAVSLAARRLRARPAWRVADLAGELKAEGDRLSRLAVGDVEVRAAFALSYGQLDEAHRRLFRRLAAHPGRDFCAHAAAALASVPVAGARAVLETLLDEHLLQGLGPDRYGLHDLLALFAAERFAEEEDAATRSAVVRRGLEWYLWTAVRADRLVHPHGRRVGLDPVDPPLEQPPLATPADAHDWYDAERLNLTAAARVAAEHGHDDIAWKLPTALFGFRRARQSWQEFRDVLASAHDAARRSGDPVGDAWVHNGRGIGEAMLGDMAASRRHFERAVEIYRALGDTEGEGVALNNLGENARRSGDFDTAIDLYRRDLEISRASGNQASIASSLDNIGKTELGRGRLPAAAAALEEALTLAGAVGDRHCAAEVLHDLGEVAAAAGDRAAAAEHYRRSADLYEQLGDLAGAATALAGRAETTGGDEPVETALSMLPRIAEPFAGRILDRLERARSR